MKKIFVILSFFLVILISSFQNIHDIHDGTTLAAVGKMAPDFTAYTLDGKKITLSHLRGKVVLINFFTTWCGPCTKEMPGLEKEFWQAYKDKGFVILAIGREESPDKLIPFVKQIHVTYPVLADPDRSIYALYATQYIPRNFLIGKDGRVIYCNIGYTREGFRELKERVHEVLGH